MEDQSHSWLWTPEVEAALDAGSPGQLLAALGRGPADAAESSARLARVDSSAGDLPRASEAALGAGSLLRSSMGPRPPPNLPTAKHGPTSLRTNYHRHAGSSPALPGFSRSTSTVVLGAVSPSVTRTPPRTPILSRRSRPRHWRGRGRRCKARDASATALGDTGAARTRTSTASWLTPVWAVLNSKL